MDSIIDKTFPLRLYGFVNDVTVCDAMSEEEKEYLIHMSKKILKYQMSHMDEEDEWYYDNCKDIINRMLKS